MIDELSATYNIDQERIYANGFSNGGFFSLQLACQLSSKIAAVASVGGSMTPETYAACHVQHPVPVLFIHGTADSTVPYEGISWSEPLPFAISYWVNTDHCNPDVTITMLPDLDATDGSTVEHHRYGSGDNGVSVEHYKIINGTHSWPGTSDQTGNANQDINASVRIWQFLSHYDIQGKM
jgi:polyhydroxybutyrate depolymerase